MSARIAPRTDTMGIGFSPHLPRFTRQHNRKTQRVLADEPAPPGTHHYAVGLVEIDGKMAPATLFEISLISNQAGSSQFSPHEAARRLQEDDWSPSPGSFHMTDKVI